MQLVVVVSSFNLALTFNGHIFSLHIVYFSIITLNKGNVGTNHLNNRILLFVCNRKVIYYYRTILLCLLLLLLLQSHFGEFSIYYYYRKIWLLHITITYYYYPIPGPPYIIWSILRNVDKGINRLKALRTVNKGLFKAFRGPL